MKLLVEVDGTEYALNLRNGGGQLEYALAGASANAAGSASVVAAGPGTYSVLLGERSFTVRLARTGRSIEVQAGGRRYEVAIRDARDRGAKEGPGAKGPLEIRSQMPGKVVKLLMEVGATVEKGQGLLVVEAMKMQNEIKSPKAGVVKKLLIAEGSTVAGGEGLLVIE